MTCCQLQTVDESSSAEEEPEVSSDEEEQLQQRDRGWAPHQSAQSIRDGNNHNQRSDRPYVGVRPRGTGGYLAEIRSGSERQ
jgi:hypothetical protein